MELEKIIDLANRRLGKFVLKYELYLKELNLSKNEKNKLLSWMMTILCQSNDIGRLNTIKNPIVETEIKTLGKHALTQKFDQK